MSKKRKPVPELGELVPETVKVRKTFTVNVEPRSPAQHETVRLWSASRILFLVGPAGCGKTHVSLALALREALSRGRGKIMLTRPMITVDEDIGFLPGTVDEKVMPWLLPFHDVLGEMSFSRWEDMQRAIEVEVVPLGMMRGRTIRNGTLLCDEFQNATYEQIKCVLTRIGRDSRIVISGDPHQSDRFNFKDSPLLAVAKKLSRLESVAYVQFDAVEDQLRDPIVSEMLRIL